MNVVIVDYKLGNLKSVSGAVKKVGFSSIVSGKKEDILIADRLILPGVGAYGDGMDNLRQLGLIETLETAVMGKKIPILGICLGCQLMAEESFEFGHHKGLGWIKGSVVKFDLSSSGLRIPHVGWNTLIKVKQDPVFYGIPDETLFYYVHSFFLNCKEDIVIGECEYGSLFTAAFHKNNIYGTQFHPEKSQRYGLEFLKNFLSEVGNAA